MSEWGPVVAVGIFLATNIIVLVKAYVKLSENNLVLSAKFEERTNAILTDIRKINQTLSELADVKNDLKRLHEDSRDHELRIRKLEGSS